MSDEPYSLVTTESSAASDHWLQMQARIPLIVILVASSALSVALFVLRSQHIGAPVYFFLNWNLFLAWLPLLAAVTAWIVQGEAQRPRLRVIPMLALWLLFLPNAPYIVTDLMHLKQHEGVPIWYDAIMLLTYAWNGLMVGFVSLWIVQGLVTRWFGVVAGWAGAMIALGLAAVGIYLGRFERWNSWDIFTNPQAIFGQLLGGLLNPADNMNAIVVTSILCGVLIVMYLTLAALGDSRDSRRR
jgi:uncharacterized membrane protein